jgi:hypothetical protein
MHNRRVIIRLFSAIVAPALLAGALATAQTSPTSPAHPAPAAHQAPVAPAAVATAPVPNERDVAATQTELIRLLRLSPTLTTVVSHDASLLSNQDYVARNNPQLASFLTAHPEVARNPDFYLFTHLNRGEGEPDEALQHAVWPDLYRDRPRESPFGEFITHDFGPLAAFLGFLVALIWMVRVFLENRRWSRVFKLQSEVHGKLIDKFTSTQELAAYMETESGKRFLEAAPIPVSIEPAQRVPNAVARVLTPLQIGIVLVLLGIGLLSLRHAGPEMETPMLFIGTVVLMPGIGFIISAGITWLLAARLGLMPENPAVRDNFDRSLGSSAAFKDRQ